MGVKGLWALLEKLGVPVDLETLQNEVLAIDISIWLNQSIKGYRDKRGRSLENSHILGLFQRICKLLFYKIKPVFVFDGGAPYLKRQTIDARNNRKLKSLQSSERTARNALKTYLSKQIKVPLNIDRNVEPVIGLESTRRILLKDDDTFNLPVIEEEEMIEEEMQVNHDKYDAKLNEFQNVDNVDFESESFKSLPAEIRHELLTNLKERRKGWTRIKEFPIETTEFSTYQMNRLLHKREIQQNIEKVEDEMQNTTDMCFEWMSSPVKCKSRRMMSDENTHLIYIDKSKPQLPTDKTKNISNLSVKKSENIFAEVSEFDFGKSEAIKEDKSSFIQNTSTFSSIRATKFLKRTLNSDLKNRKASSSATSTFTSSQNDQDFVVSGLCENTVEIKNTVNELENYQNSKQSSLFAEELKEPSTKEPDFVDLESHSSESFEDVSEISEESYRPETLTTDEHVVSSTLENNKESCKTLSSKGLCNQLREDTESISEEEKEEMVKTSDVQCGVILDFIDEKHSSTAITSVQETENAERLISSDDSPNKSIKFGLCEGSSRENSPQKSNQRLFTQLRESLKTSPCKKTREELGKELYLIEREVGRLERHANTISEQMINECQELLRLFGIPYVVSPMEAEAQCAALENIGLTSGTITDDSDIWLFGGKKVYKNFFTQSKFVEMYTLKDIEEHLKLNRASMICLALLTGSDYTEGVEGVGAVTAVEILSEFNEPGFDALLSFKKWWSDKQSQDKSPGNKTRAKFIKLTLNEGFPNRVVFDAYWSPIVDETPETFQWGIPDLDLLRDFAVRKFGWTRSKVDETLLPVIKKLNEKKVQKRIDDYFKCDIRRNGQIANSKRVMSAIHKLGNQTECNQSSTTKSKTLPISSLKRKVMKNTVRGRSKKTKNNSKVSTKDSTNILKGNKCSKSQLSESSSSED